MSRVFASHAASCCLYASSSAPVRSDKVVLLADIGEECLQPVVILVQDRIELVIVAAGAAVSQAHEDRAHGVGDIVQSLLPPQFDTG